MCGVKARIGACRLQGGFNGVVGSPACMGLACCPATGITMCGVGSTSCALGPGPRDWGDPTFTF